MRIIALAALCCAVAGSAVAQGQHYVNGYTRSDGTYVAPHYQTNPNGTVNDNWSTQGNVNPYTGQEGTKPRDNGYGYQTPATPTYGSPYGQPSYGSSYTAPGYTPPTSSFGQTPPAQSSYGYNPY